MTPTRREFFGTVIASAAAGAAPSRFSPEFASALDAAGAIRAKRVSSLELTELAFSRIDRCNPKINAVILQFREQSLARAREADLALARKNGGAPSTVSRSPSRRRLGWKA